MTNPEQFEEVLDNLSRYVQKINDEITAESVEGIAEITYHGEQIELTGHRCIHGAHIYTVAGHPEIEYFNIGYLISLAQNIGNRLPDGIVQRLVTDLDGVELEDARYQAGVQLLDQVQRQSMDSFKLGLFLIASNTSTATTLENNDEGSLLAYSVSKKIFPYQEDFTISDFEEAAQTVVSTGSRARSVLARGIHLNVDQERPERTELTLSIPDL